MSTKSGESAFAASSPVFDTGAVEAGIAGTVFAGTVRHFPAVTSTNSVALDAAQQGARCGVWVAEEQTAGRGRGGHAWHSAPGDGLYVSALIAPPLSIAAALLLSLATGLAAHAAIAECTGLQVDIRWPNDLLLHGRKCGGILVETAVAPATGGAEAMLRYAVIGVGINLNHAAFPAELAGLATSLRIERGETVSRELLLGALLRRIDVEVRSLVDDHPSAGLGESLLERFAAVSTWVHGKRVSVDEGGGYTGVTAGLDKGGFLRVAGDDGTLHTVLSGGVREL